METRSIQQVITGGTICLFTLVSASPAAASGNFYLKPHIGISMVEDTGFDQTGVVAPGAGGDGEYDDGWNAGLGFGYRYGNGWSAEIDWEYRTNDNDSVTFTDGTKFTDGDLASNIFYLNGYYTFEVENKNFRPYVGAGLGWVEEIDLDLETGGVETSYSGDGDIAWQLMAGLETDIADSWRLQGELRYTRISNVDLDQEGGAGAIDGLDYDAWTIGIGVVYDF
jgi:outer membrane autotransporter protein